MTDNFNKNQSDKDKSQNLIDTDNDGKTRQKGDTSDHGDPRSPYGKKKQDDNEESTDGE